MHVVRRSVCVAKTCRCRAGRLLAVKRGCVLSSRANLGCFDTLIQGPEQVLEAWTLNQTWPKREARGLALGACAENRRVCRVCYGVCSSQLGVLRAEGREQRRATWRIAHVSCRCCRAAQLPKCQPASVQTVQTVESASWQDAGLGSGLIRERQVGRHPACTPDATKTTRCVS